MVGHNLSVGEEETVSISRLQKHADKHKAKNVTKNTDAHLKIKTEESNCNGIDFECDFAYGDYVSDQLFRDDDETILEELLKIRQTFIRPEDLCVFPVHASGRKKKNDREQTTGVQRLTRARSVLADATERTHLGKKTLVFKGGNQKKSTVYHEDTSDYIVASTTTQSGEITPEQLELLKKAQSRELATQTPTTMKKFVRISKEQPVVVSYEMCKEEVTTVSKSNKPSEKDNVYVKLIGNIKKFCGCLPENMAKPSETTQRRRRKPRKVDNEDNSKQEKEKLRRCCTEVTQTEVFALSELQTPTFDQIAREAGETSEEAIVNDLQNNAADNVNCLRKDVQRPLKNKNKRRPSLKCGKLRYTANRSNDCDGKLKCSLHLTGKDKGDLMLTGEDGKTHTLTFRINKDANIPPGS